MAFPDGAAEGGVLRHGDIGAGVPRWAPSHMSLGVHEHKVKRLEQSRRLRDPEEPTTTVAEDDVPGVGHRVVVINQQGGHLVCRWRIVRARVDRQVGADAELQMFCM